MSLEAQRVCVESVFKAAMVAAHPECALAFQNADVNEHTGIRATCWVLDGRSHEANIGARVVDRHVGLVQITISVPERQGTSQANKIADFLGGVFRRQQYTLLDNSLLRFRVPYFNYTGNAGGYAHVIVRIPYFRDEVAA